MLGPKFTIGRHSDSAVGIEAGITWPRGTSFQPAGRFYAPIGTSSTNTWAQIMTILDIKGAVEQKPAIGWFVVGE